MFAPRAELTLGSIYRVDALILHVCRPPRKLWVTLGGEPDPSRSEALARDFCDELTQAFNEAKAE